MWAKLIYRPERFDIPDGLKPLLANRFGVMVDVEPVILRADLDEDGEFEYILMLLRENGAVSSAFYYRTDAGWQQGQLQHVWAYRGDDLRERIINGEIELVKPRFKSLQVGGITLRALPIE
jgi:hypothetical protein